MRTRLTNFAPIALLWLGGVACDRAPAAPRGARLPFDAPLPTEFAASTTLRLGDPVLAFLYVRSAVLEDPDQAGALRAYVRARTRAQLWAADHPEEWLKAYFVDEQHLSEAEGRTLLSELSFPSDWRDVIARTQETIDLLAARTGRTSFPAERLFDQRFSSVASDVTLASASVSGSGTARASLQRDVP